MPVERLAKHLILVLEKAVKFIFLYFWFSGCLSEQKSKLAAGHKISSFVNVFFSGIPSLSYPLSL